MHCIFFKLFSPGLIVKLTFWLILKQPSFFAQPGKPRPPFCGPNSSGLFDFSRPGFLYLRANRLAGARVAFQRAQPMA